MRLHQKKVGAGVAGQFYIEAGIGSRENKDRDVPPGLGPLQLLQSFAAILYRHVQIKNDKIRKRAGTGKMLQQFFAVFDLGYLKPGTGVAHPFDEKFAVYRIVIGQ